MVPRAAQSKGGRVSTALVPTDDVQLETETLSLTSQCRTLRVTDQASYDLAVNIREAARALLRKAEKYFDDLRIPAYRAYQAVLDKQNAVVPKIKNDIKTLDNEIVRHSLRMQEEQRRLERE